MLERVKVKLWLSQPVRDERTQLFPLGRWIEVPGVIASQVNKGFMVLLETPGTFLASDGQHTVEITVNRWYVFAPTEDVTYEN
jgi:hypothetical protein